MNDLYYMNKAIC